MTDRRLHAMDLGRRDHTRWLGVHRVSSRLTLPTTGLLAAWDARLGVTDVSGACSAWADQSGNGFHATQGVAGNRPTITTVDGYPSLLFDGSTDCFLTSVAAAAGPRTFYAVIRPTVALRGLFDCSAGRLYVGANADVHRIYDTGLRNTGVAVTNTRQRVCYQIDSNLLSFWRNDVAATPVACANNPAIGGSCRIGSDYTGAAVTQGHILFLAIYSSTRNTAVEAYITQEWGV